VALVVSCASVGAADTPNIVIIFADDLRRRRVMRWPSEPVRISANLAGCRRRRKTDRLRRGFRSFVC